MTAVRTAIAKTPAALLAARMRVVFNLPRVGTDPPIEAPTLYLHGTEDIMVPPDLRALRNIAPRFT